MKRRSKVRKWAAFALLAVLSLVVAACGSDSEGSTETTTSVEGTDTTASAVVGASGELEIFSWWTSGSEHTALEQLFAVLNSTDPDVEIIDAAVAGGAGSNARQVLATRLASGDIPATWQTHAGGALVDYVDQGVTVDLTDLYATQGWADVLPESLLESLTVNGEIHAVATGVHRGNNLFYNKAVLDAAGVTLDDDTTFAELEAAADAIAATGVAPLCLGDVDVWTDVTLLENLILAEVGADTWMGLLNGDISWSDPGVVTAVGNLSTALSWAQEDHQALDWTGAVQALADGRCAFNSMGDWAYGELLVKQELVDGVDFDSTVLGDANIFATVTDVFVVGAGSDNEDGAIAWMKALMDPDGQLSFSRFKGSSPARNDVDVSTGGPIAQRNAAALADGILVPSLVQDQALIPPAISQAFSESVVLLVATGDVEAFTSAMDAAIAAG